MCIAQLFFTIFFNIILVSTPKVSHLRLDQHLYCTIIVKLVCQKVCWSVSPKFSVDEYITQVLLNADVDHHTSAWPMGNNPKSLISSLSHKSAMAYLPFSFMVYLLDGGC
jgi:hypothetical protein